MNAPLFIRNKCEVNYYEISKGVSLLPLPPVI